MGEINRADAAIFADTGWEPKAVYDHLEWLIDWSNEHGGVPIEVVSKGNIRDDVLNHVSGAAKWSNGQPPFYVINRETKDGMSPDTGGSLWRKCTKNYKIDPIHAKIREMLGYETGQRVKETVTQLMGISVDEAHRMKDSGKGWIVNKYPLVDLRMSRHNCQKWLNRNGFPEPPKSACIGCPYHANDRWRDMKLHQTDEWDDVVRFDHALREQPYPGVTGMVYTHRDCIPIDEVDLTTAEDHGQVDMFSAECEGYCGF